MFHHFFLTKRVLEKHYDLRNTNTKHDKTGNISLVLGWVGTRKSLPLRKYASDLD